MMVPPGASRDFAYTIVLANSAQLLMVRRELDQAKALLVEAIEQRERLFGDLHPQTAILLSHLSRIYRRQGNLGDAQQSLLRAMAAFRRRRQTEDPNYGTLLVDFSVMQAQDGQLKLARDTCIEGLAILRRTRPSGHIDIVKAEEHLSKLGETT
jgi:hypothetical protein